MILHIPHSSRTIPADVRRTLLLTGDELEHEIRRMTDLWTDELFAGAARQGDTVVVYPVSRLVVDPERFPDDNQEPMAAHGLGVVYCRTSTGKPLRLAPTVEERDALLARFYRPHHEKLERAVENELHTLGRALIIDCHSFPSKPLPYEQERRQPRPEICIGTDDYHTPKQLGERAAELFRGKGYAVALNTPFSGAMVPLRWYRTKPAVWSVMIEVRRDMYMDEYTCELLPYSRTLRDDLCATIGSLAVNLTAADQIKQP